MNSKVFCAVAVVVALLLSTPVSAQLVGDAMAFAVVARGPGLAGTQWVTDLTIFNPMDYEVRAIAVFLPANQDNTPSPLLARPIVVGPGETLLLEDVLETTFDIADDAKGMMTLSVRSGDTPNPVGTVVHAVTRTYNTGGGGGTYGQTIRSEYVDCNVGWDVSLITGARNDGSYRSNLGIANMFFASRSRVHYRVLASDGAVIVEGSKVVKIQSMNQWSFDQLGVGVVEGPLSVELWLDPDDVLDDPCAAALPQGFFAYVSKVDNLSGDAEFLPAVPRMPFICELYE